jgi:excisionase family DNA binding protein
MENRLRSINEAWEILGVSPYTVRRLIDRSELVAVNISRRVLIPQAEIDRLCSVGTRHGTPQPTQPLPDAPNPPRPTLPAADTVRPAVGRARKR